MSHIPHVPSAIRGEAAARGDAVQFSDRIASAHIPGLDGLRAVAVGGVLLFHYGVLPFWAGGVGVSLFFVISGFLITHLLLKEYEQHGTISLRSFYVRRALRIFPAYYVFLAFSFILMRRLGQEADGKLFASAITYAIDYVEAIGHYRSTLISHSWSLAVEEQFYLLWPAALVLLLRRGANVLQNIAVAALAIVLWRIALIAAGYSAYIYYAFETRADYLLVGCAIAVGARSAWMDTVSSRLSAYGANPLLSLALCIALFVMPFARFGVSVGHTLMAVCLGAFLVQSICLSATPMWRWLEWEPVRYVGRISYPIYLYHQAATKLLPANLSLRWSVQLLVSGLITLALAMASYHIVERPFLQLKERWARPSIKS
jgi:peptidoglycan/LPS O-acetylase OafA/YrhL